MQQGDAENKPKAKDFYPQMSAVVEEWEGLDWSDFEGLTVDQVQEQGRQAAYDRRNRYERAAVKINDAVYLIMFYIALPIAAILKGIWTGIVDAWGEADL